MDKVKLNEQQLLTLIDFIDRRGFHDTGVIVEILDHFACKVEEKMTTDRSLTLEDAMQVAHAEFGTLGFYPLLAAYEKNTKKKYRTLYKAERNKVLTNPFYIVPAILLSLVAFAGYKWANTHALVWDTNLFSILIYAVFIITDISFLMKFKLPERKNKITETIMYKDFALVFFVTVMLPLTGPYRENIVMIPAVMAGFACFYLITRYCSVYATLKTGLKEINMVNDYLKSKGCSYLP